MRQGPIQRSSSIQFKTINPIGCQEIAQVAWKVDSTLPLIVPWVRLVEAQSWNRWFKVCQNCRNSENRWKSNLSVSIAEGTRRSSPAKPSRKSFADRTFRCHKTRVKHQSVTKRYEKIWKNVYQKMLCPPRNARSQSLGPYSNCHRSYRHTTCLFHRFRFPGSVRSVRPETPATPRKLKPPMSPTANRPAPRGKPDKL